MKTKLYHIDIGDRSCGHLCLWVPVEPEDSDMLAVRDAVLNAYNQHAALVAVAEAVIKQVSVHPGTEPKGHNEWECLICGVRSAIKSALSESDFHHSYCAFANLAAIRSWQPVAAVKYEEAVFNTKEDADFWIAQERRNAGFHVIEAAKAVSGFKVVFERRNGGVK